MWCVRKGRVCIDNKMDCLSATSDSLYQNFEVTFELKNRCIPVLLRVTHHIFWKLLGGSPPSHKKAVSHSAHHSNLPKAPIDISRIRDNSPPPLRVDFSQTQGGWVDPQIRFGDPKMTVSPLEILIFGVQKPNFFRPAAGRIWPDSLDHKRGVSWKGGVSCPEFPWFA